MYQSEKNKGRTTGPFVKNGIDLYEADGSIQGFIVITLFLIVVGFFIYVGVGINNFPFEHTYFKNPGAPGVLTSTRYSARWIILMLSVLAVGLSILFICFMVIFRFNYGCHMVWFIMYSLAFGLIVFVLVTLGTEYVDCNNPTQPTNLCNDKRWCCVNFVNPANQCSNVGPCPGVTSSDLVPNEEFMWVFWTLVAIGVLHFVFFVVVIIYWFSAVPESITAKHELELEHELDLDRRNDERYEYEYEKETEEFADRPIPVSNNNKGVEAWINGGATSSKRTGLRERKIK